MRDWGISCIAEISPRSIVSFSVMVRRVSVRSVFVMMKPLSTRPSFMFTTVMRKSALTAALSVFAFAWQLEIPYLDLLQAGRSQGGVGDPDFFAAMQLVVVPLVLVLSSEAASKRARLILYFALLCILYYADARLRLIYPSVADLDPWQAILISIGLLGAAWVVYDLVCRLLGERPLLLAATILGLV